MNRAARSSSLALGFRISLLTPPSIAANNHPRQRRFITINRRPIIQHQKTSPLPTTRPKLNSHHHVFVPTPSSRRTIIIEPALHASHAVITALHAFTPWWLTIPLFSLAIHAVFRFPLQLYSQHVILRLRRLSFLRLHLTTVHVHAKSLSDPKIDFNHAARQAGREFDRVHKIQRWRYLYLPLAAFPGWLLGGETVRRVVGGHVGILGLISGAARDENIKYLADPTMASGGFGWVTDLTASDPYHVLPILLGGAMLYRTAPRSWADWRLLLNMRAVVQESARDAGLMGPARLERVMRRYFVLFSVLLPWLVWDLEVALQLYWLSTLAFSSLSSVAIRRLVTSPYQMLALKLTPGNARAALRPRTFVMDKRR